MLPGQNLNKSSKTKIESLQSAPNYVKISQRHQRIRKAIN